MPHLHAHHMSTSSSAWGGRRGRAMDSPRNMAQKNKSKLNSTCRKAETKSDKRALNGAHGDNWRIWLVNFREKRVKRCRQDRYTFMWIPQIVLKSSEINWNYQNSGSNQTAKACCEILKKFTINSHGARFFDKKFVIEKSNDSLGSKDKSTKKTWRDQFKKTKEIYEKYA